MGEGAPILASVATAPLPTRLPLESAETLKEQEARGLGVLGGVTFALLNTLKSAALTPGVADYSDIYDNGFGFSGSIILRRPTAATVSAGDSYALGSLSYYSLGAKPGAIALDDMSVIGFWLDGKTVLEILGRGSLWRSYVVYGLGLVRTSEVGSSLGGILYEGSFVPAVRAKTGIELRMGSMGIFADVGVEIIAPPGVAPNATYTTGEPVFITPLTAGVIINF